MAAWIMNDLPTIAAAVIIFLLVCLAMAKIIRDRRAGKTSCGSGGCGGCAYASFCSRKDPDRDQS